MQRGGIGFRQAREFSKHEDAVAYHFWASGRYQPAAPGISDGGEPGIRTRRHGGGKDARYCWTLTTPGSPEEVEEKLRLHWDDSRDEGPGR